jgi:hypothetical protein
MSLKKLTEQAMNGLGYRLDKGLAQFGEMS